MRPVGTHLYGRRLYEVMLAWETLDLAGESAVSRDFAALWRATPPARARPTAEPGRRAVRRRPGRVRTHMVSGQIVAIVVLLVLVLGGALAWWLFRRNNTAQRQIDATRHREEAASRTASADRLEAEAAERATRARREQAQAEELAEMARRDRELAQSQIAKAERLDPEGSRPSEASDGPRPVEATPVEPPARTISRTET